MDRESMVARLREELADREKRLQDKSDYLDEAIRINRSPHPTRHTQERVRLAARAYRRAVEERAVALARLSLFMADNIVLESLKTRGPQKAGTKPAYRQSA